MSQRILFLVFTASFAAMADQMPEVSRHCGTIQVSIRQCQKTAPCINGLFLKGMRPGGHPVELVDGNGLQADLEAANGRYVCVDAFSNDDGTLSVIKLMI